MSDYFVSPADCRQQEIFPGVTISTMAGEQMMISLVELQPLAVVERHQHPHEQVGILLSGELTFTIEDETKTLKPGDMWRIPGGVPHRVVAGDMTVKAIDIFCPVREDYR